MKSNSLSVFERRFDVLLYAVRATKSFTVSDICECVLDCGRATAMNSLSDLVSINLLEKLNAYEYQATAMAKELMGVQL